MHSSILNFSRSDKETDETLRARYTNRFTVPETLFKPIFLYFFFGGGGQVHCGCGADSSESALTANKTQGAVLI